MGQKALKLELIEWIANLENKDLLEILKSLKESHSNNNFGENSDSKSNNVSEDMLGEDWNSEEDERFGKYFKI